MALSDDMIGRLNPWWTDRHWADLDPYLKALEDRPSIPPHPFVRELQLGDRSTHVIRGPRQVGKSTGLKLLIGRILADRLDARRVIHLNLDLLEDQPLQEMAATITRAKQIAAVGDEPCLVLLDEVTAVRGWARAVKALWDAGSTRNDTVVCTGSSAIDLARGEVEGLPGRRGTGLDRLILPQSFAAFARVVDERIPPSPGTTIGELLSREGRGLLERNVAIVPALNQALDLYLRFGGLPASVAEAASGMSNPSGEVRRVIWDSITKEVLRRGASEPALRALLERVIRSLGSKTSWSTVAREMDVPLGGRRTPPDGRSVRDYVEFLGRCYQLMTVYFWKTGSDTSDLPRDKKLYFGDPLLQTVALDLSPGLNFDKPAAIENLLAVALYRRYEATELQANGFQGPSRLHVYETSGRREIDFICGPRRQAELLEVKYQASVRLAATQAIRKAFPTRPGIVASNSDLHLGDHVAVAPAALALWALG